MSDLGLKYINNYPLLILKIIHFEYAGCQVGRVCSQSLAHCKNVTGSNLIPTPIHTDTHPLSQINTYLRIKKALTIH